MTAAYDKLKEQAARSRTVTVCAFCGGPNEVALHVRVYDRDKAQTGLIVRTVRTCAPCAIEATARMFEGLSQNGR